MEEKEGQTKTRPPRRGSERWVLLLRCKLLLSFLMLVHHFKARCTPVCSCHVLLLLFLALARPLLPMMLADSCKGYDVIGVEPC